MKSYWSLFYQRVFQERTFRYQKKLLITEKNICRNYKCVIKRLKIETTDQQDKISGRNL